MSAGKNTDPGMAGSLLYHMAMVTKMEAETRFLLQEFPETAQPSSEKIAAVSTQTSLPTLRELSKSMLTVNVNPNANLN